MERIVGVDLSPGVQKWLVSLTDSLGVRKHVSQVFYSVTVLATAAERLASLDSIALKRPFHEAITLGKKGFPKFSFSSSDDPTLLFEAAADQANTWLKKHPDSEAAQRVAKGSLSASFEDHIVLVREMYREWEKEEGLPTTDTMLNLLKESTPFPETGLDE